MKCSGSEVRLKVALAQSIGGGSMAGLREFVVQFGTEEQCIEHLAGLRWPGGFACAGCGGGQALRLKTRPGV